MNPLELDNKPENRSSNYGFISTKEVLRNMENRGWYVNKTTFGRKLNPSQEGTQKHMVVLENDDVLGLKTLSDNHVLKPNVTILNSHDCTTSFRMFIGFTRVACFNGLIAGQGIGNFRVIHSNNMIKNILFELDKVLQTVPNALVQAQSMIHTKLNDDQILEFNKKVIQFRLQKVERLQSMYYQENLLPRRTSDLENDVFTVMNRAQEYLINGGIQYSYLKLDPNNDNYPTLTNGKTRKVSSVVENIKYNQFVWNEALKLVQVE